MLHKAACYPTKCDVINDVKLFPRVCCRIYCRKILTLSNQMSHYKSKPIRVYHRFMLCFFKNKILFSLYSAAFVLGLHYLSTYLHYIYIFIKNGLGLDIDTCRSKICFLKTL